MQVDNMDTTAQNSSSRKLHKKKKHKHEKKDIEYGNMRMQKKKKKKHRNKDKNLNENGVLSKHCHKTDSGTGDKQSGKESEEELSSPSEHKKHKKKKHKRKEKENGIEDGNKMKKPVESRLLSKKCHTTNLSTGDEQSGRKESQVPSSKSKHKKHKKKRMQSEDHLLTEECKKRRIRPSNDLMSADDTCLMAAEHSGISVGYKKKRKHRVEDNDCDNLAWMRHGVGFSENSPNSSLSSDLLTADNRAYSDSSGAIVGVSESERRKRKTPSPAKNENPRKKHKHKHKKDLVGKVEDQSYTCSENSVADEDLRHQEHLKTAAISIKSVSTERIENKIAVRNSEGLSRKRKQTAKSLSRKSDKYVCSEVKRVKSVLENLNSKNTSNNNSKKRRVQEAGDADETQSMSEVAEVSRAVQNEAARGDQGAEVHRHWRRNVPTLTMEESIAKLGREMRSTSNGAYWTEIRALLQERKISYRTGFWTKREDEILRRNWEALLKEVNLEAHEIIYGTRTENYSSTRQMINDKKFYRRLSEGLSRTSDSVYQRARRIFDEKHQGLMHILTEEEKLQLDSLFLQYGKKWRKISDEMGYSQQSIVNYFHDLELTQVNSAPFSEDEDEAIVEWVRHVTGRQDVSKAYRLPWVQILSQKSILTQNKRTSEQCRLRWLGGLCWKLANPGKTRRKFSADDQAKLIRLIYESDAMEDSDIDFENLMQEFEHVPSPQKMKGIWHKISFIVPDYQWKQFTDIIEYLNDVYLPRLEYNHDLISIIDEWSDED